MKYVFLKLTNYKKMYYIECIKVDNNFNNIKIYKSKFSNDKKIIIDLINFVKGNIVIGYDLPKTLIYLLTIMHQLKIYDCVFYYFDMKDYLENIKNIKSIKAMIELMKVYSYNDLNNIKYIKNKSNFIAYRIFRGLNYKLYLLDKGYYIYDKSVEKTASFYVHKKELSKNWNYTEEEYLFLKNNGANFITNIFHISDDTLKYTNEYTIYSNNKLKDYKYMVDKMENTLNYLDKHPNINIHLICIGTIEELKENYKILGEDKIIKIIKLIKMEKKLWSKW